MSFSATLTGRKGYGEPTDRTIKAVVATMHARTQELLDRTYDLSEKLEGETKARTRPDDELGGRLDAEGKRIDEVTRDIAVGGLRLQMLGLFLVSLGLAFQSVGQVVN